MIVRELDHERTLFIRQEDHADLAAQFAAHWGNASFSKPDPHDSLLCAAAYHDTHFRDVEALLPIDKVEGRPYGHRATPFSMTHLDAMQENIAWVDRRDRYAALLISMHHSGLPQNRYGVIKSWQNVGGQAPRNRPMRQEVAAMVQKMESKQRAVIQEFGERGSASEKQIWFNFRLLEVFDLLSLYLCCDGYADGGYRETWLGPIPIGSLSDQETNIHLIPSADGSLRIDPYPLDCCPFSVSVRARVVKRLPGRSEEECRTEFWRSPYANLSWVFTD